MNNKQHGYKESALLDLLARYPRAIGLMQARSLIFAKDNNLNFPSLVSKESESSDPEAVDHARRRRIALHTVAVGLNMNLLLTLLKEKGALRITSKTLNTLTELMILHDLNKMNEIFWRNVMVDDDAYDLAEEVLSAVLCKSGFSTSLVKLSSSVGHNGAKDFVTDSSMWPLTRQCAYLADDLLQETKIQENPLAKVTRLKSDSFYAPINKVGFPDRKNHSAFVRKDGTLVPKYDIQEKATTEMLKNVGGALGIGGMELGSFLIAEAIKRGLYWN